jgi:hypothetical protein
VSWDRAGLEAAIDASRERAGDNSWTYHSRVSVAHRYVCMSVPKVACTTVKRTLHEFEGLSPAGDWGQVHDQGADLRLSSFASSEIADMLLSPDWLRFAFVRDPYDRLFSAWKSKIGNTWDTQYHWLRDGIRTAEAYPARGSGPPATVAFRDFVRFVFESDDPWVTNDAHWDLQTNVLLCGLVPYDVIGRFERFSQDFDTILRRLGAPESVLAMAAERTNSTTQVPLAAAYDRDLADRVYARYEPDFETFGYERESWRFHQP